MIELIVIALLFPFSDAHAYLDAGTGSMLLQTMLGGVAGLVVVVRMYGRSLVDRVHTAFSKKTVELPSKDITVLDR